MELQQVTFHMLRAGVEEGCMMVDRLRYALPPTGTILVILCF